jgi:hypothetical protein
MCVKSSVGVLREDPLPVSPASFLVGDDGERLFARASYDIRRAGG